MKRSIRTLKMICGERILKVIVETCLLTEEEKKEQQLLRKEFLASVRMNLKSQLDNIDILNKDGSVENLGEKYGQKLKEKGN